MINQVAESRQQQVDLLLRIDPDVVSLALKKDTAAGKQHSPQPKRARKVARQFRKKGGIV